MVCGDVARLLLARYVELVRKTPQSTRLWRAGRIDMPLDCRLTALAQPDRWDGIRSKEGVLTPDIVIEKIL